MEERERTTTDLADFGYRELKLAIALLDAYGNQGLPEDFEEDGVRVMFNTESGYVFLTNSEYQVAMMNGVELENFYVCPECGREGFGYLFEKNANCKGCREIAGVEEEEEEVEQ